MAKKRDGIREILESGQAPGFFVRGGGGKNARDPQDYDPEHWTPQSVESRKAGLTPKQYERMQEQSVREAEKVAAITAAERRSAGHKDGEIRHIGRVPYAEYLAEEKRSGKGWWQEGDVKEKLKAKGRLFKHEK